MTEAAMISVEVFYDDATKQHLETLQVVRGTTVGQVLELSNLSEVFPELDLANTKLGIYGKFVGVEVTPEAHDRIEVYRPLLVDPKEARRRRAKRDRGTR